MFYVAGLLKKSRRFLDIGSNIGIYSFYFKDIFTKIDAFEPLKEITYRLIPFQNKSFNIHHVGISSKKGKLSFYIPYKNGSPLTPLGSLEKRIGECEERLINVNTIDSYCFNDVDLIKIDVEGHEQSVILGAVKTLQRTMPILIVEIEQRHIKKNINDVFQCILDLNYTGFFLCNGRLTPLDKFEYSIHQEPFLQNVNLKDYINNFIFISKKEIEKGD